MKIYTYHFVDGTKNNVEVTNEMFAILTELDEQERKCNYNYSRHNCPLSAMDYEGEAFADLRQEPYERLLQIEKQGKIQSALEMLTEHQRSLIEQVFVEGIPQREVAKQKGVTAVAICRQIDRISKKLEKLLS